MVKLKQSLKRGSVALCLFFVILLISTTSHARIYNAVVAFGDSLSDHYGLQAYLGPYDPVLNPNGALAVWSNGDVWIEYLTASWGATLENNAIAGAMTMGHENETVQALSDNGTLPNLGLVGQVNMYVEAPHDFDPENTLFTIWIGGNDLLEFGRGESYTADPQILITDAMNNITNSVVSLYAEGATHFLILNLPDIGKTPGYNKKTPEEIASVTQLVEAYNSSLAATIEQLKLSLAHITIDTFDIFSYMTELIENGTFLNTVDTYMELDENGDKTGNVNGNAEDYLFWDNIHPMTRAHEIIADKVDDTVFSVREHDSSGCFIGLINEQNSTLHHGTFWGIAAIIMGIISVFPKIRIRLRKK